MPSLPGAVSEYLAQCGSSEVATRWWLGVFVFMRGCVLHRSHDSQFNRGRAPDIAALPTERSVAPKTMWHPETPGLVHIKFFWGTSRSSPTPQMTRVDFRQLAHGAEVRDLIHRKGSVDESGRINMGFGPRLILANPRARNDY